MESVLQNSIISTTNFSQKSNPSTARLLINHIKRLVEEDMKLTVKAFNYIENRIGFERKSESYNMDANTNNVPNRNHSNKSSVQLRKSQYSTSPSQQIEIYPDQQNNSRLGVTTTPLSTSSVDGVSCNEQYDPFVEDRPQQLYEPAMGNLCKWNGSSSDINPHIVTDNTSELETTTSDENVDAYLISFSRIRNLFSQYTDELDAIFNRINQKFLQNPDLRIPNYRRPALQTITRRVRDDCTPTWVYNKDNSTPNSAQSSFVQSRKEGKQITLPQLLISEGIHDNSSDFTTDSGRVHFETDCLLQTRDYLAGSTDRRTDNSPQSTDSPQSTNVLPQMTDVLPQTTSYLLQETDLINGLTNSPVKTVASGDGKNNDQIEVFNGEANERAPETAASKPKVSKSRNDVTITDIGSESEISSNLLVTPKRTERESQNDVVLTDLDKIASIIKQASPNRRVIIKKKLPEVDIKGYNKTCNEKIIFSGDKITHVKRDRKSMSRNICPKE